MGDLTRSQQEEGMECSLSLLLQSAFQNMDMPSIPESWRIIEKDDDLAELESYCVSYNKHAYLRHCFRLSFIHFVNHFADGMPTLSLSKRAFSISPSHTVFIDAGANAWMNEQSSANAWKPSSENYPSRHANTPAFPAGICSHCGFFAISEYTDYT